MLICMNPGHCVGLDSGAVGAKITEAELACKYARLVNQYLEAVGYKTMFVHLDSLAGICTTANNANADLFISIHFNSNDGVPATGSEVYYCEGSPNGKILAQAVCDQLKNSTTLRSRGIKDDPLYVTGGTDMIACLIEVGFINNPKDEDYCIENIDLICRAIARGITDAVSIIWGIASADKSAPTTVSKGTPLAPGMVSEHFSVNELACHHCGVQGVKKAMIDFLEDLRNEIGEPLYITSGYRCPTHNERVGGVLNSQHTKGLAADCYAETLGVYELAAIGRRLGADAAVPYPDQQFVHFDIREGRVGAGYTWE